MKEKMGNLLMAILFISYFFSLIKILVRDDRDFIPASLFSLHSFPSCQVSNTMGQLIFSQLSQYPSTYLLVFRLIPEWKYNVV